MNKKAAKRPATRTVSVIVAEGDFTGWECTARADFPAGLLADFNSNDIDRVLNALERIIIDHNFPDSTDEVATSLRDVDPYQGLLVIASQAFDEIGKLPNR